MKKDRYNRSIAIVFYNDSSNLNNQLPKNLLGWHYLKYPQDLELQKMEDIARKDKIDLLQDANAIPPWEWRDSKKKK